MVASWRGVLYAAINVVVVAALIAAVGAVDGEHSVETFYVICLIATVPALIGGAVIGAIAGRLRRYRRTIIVGAGLAIVVGLGMVMSMESLIPVGCIPTAALALLLEWKTRNEAPKQLTCTAKGALVGLACIEAVAVLAGIAASQHAFHHASFRHASAGEVISTIGIFGMIPALIVGALVGRLAHMVAGLRPYVRLGILVAATLAVTAGVEIALLNRDLVLPSLAPAVIAAILLERWTRIADAIPLARVL